MSVARPGYRLDPAPEPPALSVPTGALPGPGPLPPARDGEDLHAPPDPADPADLPGDGPAGSSPPRPRWLRTVLRWAFRGVLLILVLIVLTVGLTAGRVWQVGQQDSRRPSDAILVLGAAQFDGRPSEVFAARLDHAAALYHQHVASRIVTVGGAQPGDRFTEAQAGVNYLARQGIPRGDLVAIGEGRDTLLSLRAAALVFEAQHWRSATLVTDPWHSLRSRRMALDLGIKATSSPVTTGPATRGLRTQSRYLARETAAYLFYRLFHRASGPGPSAI